ncbi:MAG: HAD family hydrolase [Chlamydiae bacterium]|nr:MAG: HAD family hydrolase [Chlamydiota bacterium]
MKNDSQKILKDFKPSKEFFIGIDSDGCVFDSMEIKHKECFCPNFIKYFELQKISKYAREAWEFVNLYSKTRGCNRFLAVKHTLDLLKKREEVIARNAEIMSIPALDKWISEESKLGNPALEKYLSDKNIPELENVLNWSVAVNNSIAKMVYGIPPFPFVKNSLLTLSENADIMVVSQTPEEALVREWKENNIEEFARLIAGQELGTKKEHIALAAKGKYNDNKILMIGDAPGDLAAAKENGVLFYPIVPGNEEKSWQLFYNTAISKFFSKTYKGDFENNLIDEFNRCLPEKPTW